MRADDEHLSQAPPLARLLRVGTMAVTACLVFAVVLAIVIVALNRRMTDELTREVGPSRVDNALLLRTMVDAETALRGYQVTGDPATLGPYEAAVDDFPRLAESLREEVGDRDAWRALVDEQAALGERWFGEFAPEVLEIVRRGDPAASSNEITFEGQEIVDDLRTANSELNAVILDAREGLVGRLDALSIVAIVAVVVISLVVAALLVWRARRVHRLVAVPLQEIVDTIARLRRGRLDARTNVSGSLEVDLIAEAVDDLAVRTEQLRERDRSRVERERELRELTHRVRETFGRQAVLERTVREIGPRSGADRALVLSLEPGGRLREVLAEWSRPGLDPIGVGREMPSDGARDLVVESFVRSRVSAELADVANSSDVLPSTRELLVSLGIGAMMLTPVVAGDEALAALVLLTHGRPHEWPVSIMDMAEAVADELATALTHARLFEQQEDIAARLRDLDQAKSDFVSSVSHELRTPLTSIRGYVEMLRDGDAGELAGEQQHMLGIVERNTDRLLALIEDLLTLSKIESGSFRVALAPVDLADVVRSMVAELAPQASEQHVELAVEVVSEPPAVEGDVAQLERVLMNLLSNAVKFSPDGGHVLVRLDTHGGDVVLQVIDEGIGIPDAEQDRLFDRFFRSSSAHERAIQGTGLGLVIVKSIIDHHGGRIFVSSSPGMGTTFTVRLPSAPASVPAEGGLVSEAVS